MNELKNVDEKPTANKAQSDSGEGLQKKPTRFFDTAAEALCAAVPPGATVKAIGFDSVEPFLRAGYRAVDGEADVVIARGGEREFAAARQFAGGNAKLILCPTHAYYATACEKYLDIDGAFSVLSDGTTPFAAVFDSRDADRNLASIFGETVALDLDAFDCMFAARMSGRAVDDGAEEIAALVTELTDKLAQTVKDRTKSAEILAEAGKTAARIVSAHPELLHGSGASQMTEAVRMLYSAEERSLGMRGETEMLLGGYIIDFYSKNLENSAIEFPPDNNKRIDSLCEYFKTDLRRACIHTSAIYPPLKMRLCEYRRSEFRTEFKKRLAEVKRRRLAAFTVFKRLYPDDGYCLKTLVDREDLGICLALAPDVFSRDTMLSFIKQTGKLDRYII